MMINYKIQHKILNLKKTKSILYLFNRDTNEQLINKNNEIYELKETNKQLTS